ncbi:major facilitator transporter [Caballeronia udeis]|uniref:Major facilitator transporter n=1 Tax=Caballeronia udeis TaxID=1232866 RepID=A0A158HBX2_9BURK|nr:MFS transporter [Caballeronia udeis]SAL41471.1 major facilitator transporter [Caballeronia udeis]
METPYAVPLPATGRRELGASHRWKVLGVGVAANVSFSAAAAGIPTTAVWLRADYHLGNAALGLALGAMGLGVALTELSWGVATDRWGDRPILLTGLATTAAALLSMMLFVVPSHAAVPSLLWLVMSMCLVGLVGGSVNGSSGRAVMRWFQEGERGLAMSIRQTAVPLGGGLGALILPWLASTGGFRPVYGVLAALCAVSGVLAWLWLHEPPEAPAATHGGSGAAVAPSVGPLRDRMIWRVVSGIAILCVPQFAVLTFATVFLHDFGHVGIAGITATMVTVQLGAMIMRVASGRFTDKRGNRRAYLRGSTLVAVASFVVLGAAVGSGQRLPEALLIVLIAFAGICVSAWHGVAYTELATLAGKDRAGTALGMVNTAVYLGLFLTPLCIPHLLAIGSWGVVWLAAAACALVAYPLFPRPVARVS